MGRETPLNLRKFREARHVSLEDISEKTKISVRFLLAIESEEYDKLPGGIFNTSYLRQYAEAVGVEEATLLERYSRKTRSQERAPEESTRPGIFSRWFGLAAHSRS